MGLREMNGLPCSARTYVEESLATGVTSGTRAGLLALHKALALSQRPPAGD